VDLFNSNEIHKRKNTVGHFFVEEPIEYVTGIQELNYLGRVHPVVFNVH
jgi:hypothetical protein